MKPSEYKDSLSQIKASEEFKSRTVSLMRQTAQSDHHKEKTKREPIRLMRRFAITFAVLVALTMGFFAVNAAFDLSPLYEAILGERAAQYIQGIHKTDEQDGILLTMDAGYVEEHAAAIFFTLTDTEGMGRLRANGSLKCELSSTPFQSRDGGIFLACIEKSPDGQSLRYRLDYSISDRNLPGRLLRMNLFVPIENGPDGQSSYVKLTASFKLFSDIPPQRLNVDIEFFGHHIDMVTITPLGIEFTGTCEAVSSRDGTEIMPPIFPNIFIDNEDAVVFLTADGSPVKFQGDSGSYQPDGTGGYTFFHRFDGIIPDDLESMWLAGIEYSLV